MAEQMATRWCEGPDESMPVARVVADRVRVLRKARAWTVQELADRCAEAGLPSLTRSTLAKIESGVRRLISAEEIAVLAEVFELTPTQLLEADAEERKSDSDAFGSLARRRRLGVELRQARLAAGLTQAHVAEELGCTQSKILKIEAATSQLRPADLTKLVELYQVPPDKAHGIRQLAAIVPRTGPITSDSAYVRMLELEQRADEIFSLHCERIPMALQHERYLLAQVEGDVNPNMLMTHQSERARVFSGPTPTRYSVVLSESSLRRMPGGRSNLVIDQVAHLVRLAEEYDALSVQILPFDADIAYVPADFMILQFPEASGDVVYVESSVDGRLLTSAGVVAAHRRMWNEVRAAALDADESQRFLRDLTTPR